MRQISCRHTKAQILARTKTVTRRAGWEWLKPGTLLQPIEKGQGIPKGGHVVELGCPIEVVSVRREPLARCDAPGEMEKEGFPGMQPQSFMRLYFSGHTATEPITRIEFKYRPDLEEIFAGIEKWLDECCGKVKP